MGFVISIQDAYLASVPKKKHTERTEIQKETINHVFNSLLVHQTFFLVNHKKRSMSSIKI